MERKKGDGSRRAFTEPPPLEEALHACCGDRELMRNLFAELWSHRERAWLEKRWRTAHSLIQATLHTEVDQRGLQRDVARHVGVDPKTVGKIARWVIADLRVCRAAGDTGATQEVFSRLQDGYTDAQEGGLTPPSE